MNPAPIALFVYNRLSYTKRTILALKKNLLAKKSNLFIFSDYAKNSVDLKKVLLVRNFISKLKGFKNIKIIFRKKNYGLCKNILSGINYVFRFYNKIIVLEDDIVTSRSFLNYMNRNLELYELSKNIVSIHGYNYPINIKGLDNFFFIKGADCWGWATWKKKWKKYFINNSSYLANKILRKKKIKEFNFDNTYNFYKMLIDNKKNKNKGGALPVALNAGTFTPVTMDELWTRKDFDGTNQGLPVKFGGKRRTRRRGGLRNTRNKRNNHK